MGIRLNLVDLEPAADYLIGVSNANGLTNVRRYLMGSVATQVLSLIQTDIDAGLANVTDYVDLRDAVVNAAALAADAKAVAAQATADSALTLAGAAGAGLKWITQNIVVRTTANVNLATGLVNGTVINGVTLVTNQHVFVSNAQTAQTEIGLYTVPAAGAASRATFADSVAELSYIAFVIGGGTVGAGEAWTLALAAGSINIGVTALVFSPAGIGNPSAAEVAAAKAPYLTLAEYNVAQRVKTDPLPKVRQEIAFCLDTPVTGPANAASTYMSRLAFTHTGILEFLDIFALAAGTIVIRIKGISGGNWITLRTVSFAFAGTGFKRFTSADFGTIIVNAGEFAAIYAAAGTFTVLATRPYAPGFSAQSGNLATLTAPTLLTSGNPQVRFIVKYDDIAVTGSAFDTAAVQLALIKDSLNDSQVVETIGRSVVAAGDSGIGGGTFVFGKAAKRTGLLKVRLKPWTTSGNVLIETFTKVGDDKIWTGKKYEIAVTGGGAAMEVMTDLVIKKGEYWGKWSEANVIAYSSLAQDDAGWWNTAERMGSTFGMQFNDPSLSTTARLEMGADIISIGSGEAEAKVANLEVCLRAAGGEIIPPYLVADGNSIMAGDYGTPPTALLQASIGCGVNNLAVAGQTIQDMIDDGVAQIDPLSATPNVRPFLIILGEPFNWMRAAAGRTAVQAVDKIETYCLARRAAGFTRIFVCNSIWHGGGNVQSWNETTTAAAVNAQIASRWQNFCEGYIDLDDIRFNTTPALFHTDLIHPVTAGHTIIGKRIRKKIADWREY